MKISDLCVFRIPNRVVTEADKNHIVNYVLQCSEESKMLVFSIKNPHDATLKLDDVLNWVTYYGIEGCSPAFNWNVVMLDLSGALKQALDALQVGEFYTFVKDLDEAEGYLESEALLRKQGLISELRYARKDRDEKPTFWVGPNDISFSDMAREVARGTKRGKKLLESYTRYKTRQ